MGRIAPEVSAGGASHQLVRHTHFMGNNYFNTSGSSRYDWWRCTFTKQLSADDSYLIVKGSVMGTRLEDTANLGAYCTLDHWGVGTGTGSPTDQRAFGGWHHCGPRDSDDEQVIILIQKVFKADDLSSDPQPNMAGTFPSAQLGAGSHSLDLGCSASSTVKPMKYWNIGSGQDDRQHQQGAFLSIMEYRY